MCAVDNVAFIADMKSQSRTEISKENTILGLLGRVSPCGLYFVVSRGGFGCVLRGSLVCCCADFTLLIFVVVIIWW